MRLAQQLCSKIANWPVLPDGTPDYCGAMNYLVPFMHADEIAPFRTAASPEELADLAETARELVEGLRFLRCEHEFDERAEWVP